MAKIKPKHEVELPPGVTLRHTLSGHTSAIRKIAWSPDGRTLASPCKDGTVRLWDTEAGECIRTIQMGQPSWAVAFDSTGQVQRPTGASSLPNYQVASAS
jgi:WD40 repeat protein